MQKTGIIIFIIFSFILLSCGHNITGSVSVKDSEHFNIVDSLKIKSNLGDIIKREFKGNMPSSYSKVECFLLLYNQLNSGDGVYKLTQKYISSESKKSITLTTYGKQYTLRGDKTNPDAVVYQLIPFIASSEIINLLYINGNLEFLNKDFERYKFGDYVLVQFVE